MRVKSLIKYITDTFFNSAYTVIHTYIYLYTYPYCAQTRVVYDAIVIVEFYLSLRFGIYKKKNVQ